MPFGLLATGDKARPYGPVTPNSVKAPALGDLRVGAHARVYDTLPLGVFVGGRFWAPIGTEASYLSDKNFWAEVDLGVADELRSLLDGCMFPIAPSFFAQRAGDRLAAECAVHVKLAPFVSVGVEPSFAVFEQVAPNGDASAALLIEPLAAARFRFGGYRLGVAAGPCLGGAPGGAQIRMMLNPAYVGAGKPPAPLPVGPSDRESAPRRSC